jgi:nitrite reductase/ring-hydroxylating ferredoxin subunit
MKHYIFLFFLFPFLIGCNKDDDSNNRNPYLPDYNFSFTVDKDLPLYSSLYFTGNPVLIEVPGTINGVIVMNTGSGYTAFEATCPNQNITSCSRLEVEGIIATCPCDGVEYNLFTGLGAGVQYPLKSYRVEVLSENAIRISN